MDVTSECHVCHTKYLYFSYSGHMQNCFCGWCGSCLSTQKDVISWTGEEHYCICRCLDKSSCLIWILVLWSTGLGSISLGIQNYSQLLFPCFSFLTEVDRILWYRSKWLWPLSLWDSLCSIATIGNCYYNATPFFLASLVSACAEDTIIAVY